MPKGITREPARTGNLADFFAASPLRGSRLKVQRLKGKLRDVAL